MSSAVGVSWLLISDKTTYFHLNTCCFLQMNLLHDLSNRDRFIGMNSLTMFNRFAVSFVYAVYFSPGLSTQLTEVVPWQYFTFPPRYK